jgi:hypothetical protein
MTAANTISVDVNRNEAKGGVELRFDGRPAAEITEHLKKTWGFRWSRFQKIWWCRDADSNMDPVLEFLSSVADDAGMLPAFDQETHDQQQQEQKAARAKRLAHRLGTCEPQTLAEIVNGKERRTLSRKTRFIESVDGDRIVERFFIGANQLEALKAALAAEAAEAAEEKKGAPAEA